MFIDVKADNSAHFLQKEGQIWKSISSYSSGLRSWKPYPEVIFFGNSRLNSFKSLNFPLFELRTYPACKGVNMARFGVFIGGRTVFGPGLILVKIACIAYKIHTLFLFQWKLDKYLNPVVYGCQWVSLKTKTAVGGHFYMTPFYMTSNQKTV